MLLVLAGAPGLTAQQGSDTPPVIFRAEVNYVEVDAIVIDAQGNVVPNLTQADFEVLEDGKPQAIASFAHVDLPIQKAERALFTSTPIEPDVRTNQSIEGRIYLFVLDDLHTDVARTTRVKAAARRFIEQSLGANDVAAIVFTGRNDASQDFTSNTRLLLSAIDRFSGRKLPSATVDKLSNTTVDSNGVMQLGDDTAKAERAYRARSAMGSIRKLSEFMAGVRGRRKAMVLISEGIDYDVNQAMGADGATASIVLEDIRDAIAAAQRGNVTIYSIDPRGLFDPGDDLIQVGGLLTADSAAGAAVDGRNMQAEVRLSQESLRQVAVDTGGFSILNTNDFDRGFDRIVRDNSSYYLLGYYPTNDKRDGRTRKLQVRVKRPGLTVRSRSGYVAPRGKAEPVVPVTKDAPLASVSAALGSPLPVAGVPMRVFAAAFKGTAPRASVAFVVEIDASKFDFSNRDGLWVEKIELLTTALESSGKTLPGEQHKVDLALRPDTYQRVITGGLRVVGQTDLPPGRYQLRFAAGNAAGKAGSVLYDLEVPDFSKGALTMSGVALTSQGSANAMGTVRPKDPLKDYLPGPPVATREFRQGDALTLFAEVYENLRGGPVHQVAIKSELRSDTGRVVVQTSERRSSTELEGKSGGYGVTTQLPLTDVEPGIYVVHVEAQGQYEGLPTASHDIQIRVVP